MTREQLDAIRARVAKIYYNGGGFDGCFIDVTNLLAEVERLTALIEAINPCRLIDVGDGGMSRERVEADAFRRGVSAMREAAASCLDRLLTERKATAIWVSPDDLRALPDPEDTER